LEQIDEPAKWPRRTNDTASQWMEEILALNACRHCLCTGKDVTKARVTGTEAS
jgi:hypothetical protein